MFPSNTLSGRTEATLMIISEKKKKKRECNWLISKKTIVIMIMCKLSFKSYIAVPTMQSVSYIPVNAQSLAH